MNIRSTWGLKKRKLQVALSLGIFVLILFLHLSDFPKFQQFITRLNGIIYDALTLLPLNSKNLAESRVVIVDIDDVSTQEQGRWPWPRAKLAKLVQNLAEAGVAVIAFDLVLADAEINLAAGLLQQLAMLPPEEQQTLLPLKPYLQEIAPKVDQDQLLAKALAQHDVILGYLLHHGNTRKGELPPPLKIASPPQTEIAQLPLFTFTGYNGILPLFVSHATNGGFVSNVPDLDGIVRHGVIMAKFGHELYPSLALATVMTYLFAKQVTILTYSSLGHVKPYALQIEKLKIPINPQGQIVIPYPGLPGTVPYFSATDVINHRLPAHSLQGSIAIIGSTMILLADLHPSPIFPTFPGVEMNANIISAMLSQKIPQEFDWFTALGIIILTLSGITLSLLFPFLGPIALLLFYSFLFGLLVVISSGLFYFSNYFFPPALLLLLMSNQGIINFSYSFITERKQKNRIKDLFGQYVPPSYVKTITDFPERYTMAGETREMTVFFSDIRNFTSLSEKLGAAEVKQLLNTFFTPITEIIFKHQGTIDKYVGDMVMAFWGAPVTDPDHAEHAVTAVMDIKEHLAEINQNLVKNGLPAVNIGMGINTGFMDVGDMGSKFRRAYTVLGDSVNLASRLQDLTKYYHVDILVSEMTYEITKDLFFWQRIDKVQVKGRSSFLYIYEPLGFAQQLTPEKAEELSLFEQALHAYFSQDWNLAQKQLQILIKRFPNRYLYQLYQQRVQDFFTTSPPSDWDGTFIHQHK